MLALMEPFGLLWKEQVGGHSELTAMEPSDLAEMLADGKVDIGALNRLAIEPLVTDFRVEKRRQHI